MHLHGCSKQGANDRIARLKAEFMWCESFEKVKIPGCRGTGKVAMELCHVLGYVLSQNCALSTSLRAQQTSLSNLLHREGRAALPTLHAMFDQIHGEKTVTSTTTAANATNVSPEDLLTAHCAAHAEQAVPHQQVRVSRDEDDEETLRVQLVEGTVNYDLLESFTRRLDREAEEERDSEDVRFVYCIRVRGTNRVKIGFSRDPAQRLATLQTAHADLLDLELILRTSDYRARESELHRKHSGRRIRGEWFAFDLDADLLQEM